MASFQARATNSSSPPASGEREGTGPRSLQVRPSSNPPSPQTAVLVFESTTGYVLAAWGRVFFHIWRGPATVEGIRRCHDILMPWLRAHEGDVALVVAATPAQGRPSEAARQEMNRLVRASPDRLKATAMIFEADGFLAAIVRALMAGLRLLRPGPAAFEVFGTPEDAARWLRAHLGVSGFSAPDFVAAFRHAQAAAICEGGLAGLPLR